MWLDPVKFLKARPADEPVDFVAFCEKKLSQVGSVLPGNACNQGSLHSTFSGMRINASLPSRSFRQGDITLIHFPIVICVRKP